MSGTLFPNDSDTMISVVDENSDTGVHEIAKSKTLLAYEVWKW